MRKPIQVKIGFLRFLAKPLLIILLAGAFQLNVFAQISINVDACICLSNQSTPGDGQFQADITFAGFTIKPPAIVSLSCCIPNGPSFRIGFRFKPRLWRR